MQANTRQARTNTGTRIAFGVFIILISLLSFISDIGALSKVGKAISSFTIGFFGLADYAYSVVGVIIGIAIVFNLKVKLPVSKILLYSGLLALGIYALNIYTSSAHIIDANYGEYLVNCYKGLNTAGGMLFGIISYPLMKAITTVGALVVVCVAFFVIAFIALIPTIKKNVTYTADDKATQKDRERAAKARRATKEDAPVENNVLPQPEKSGLYVENMQGDPAMTNGVNGYNPLFPNSAVGIENEQQSAPSYPGQQYDPRSIAKDILFGDKVTSEQLTNFNTVNNPQSAFSSMPAQQDRLKQREIRNILGMNGAEQTINSYYVSRNDKTIETQVEEPVQEETPTDDADAKNGALGYSSFEELKAAQTKLFSARMTESETENVTPMFNTVAYDKPSTATPVYAEVEKPIVATPKTVIAKPDVKTTPQTPEKASTMSGFIGTVERAITGEEIAKPVQIVKPQDTVVRIVEPQPIKQPTQPVQQVETIQAEPTVIEKTVVVEKPVYIYEKTVVEEKPTYVSDNQSAGSIHQNITGNTIGTAYDNDKDADNGLVVQQSMFAKQQQDAIKAAKKTAPARSLQEKMLDDEEKRKKAFEKSIRDAGKSLEKNAAAVAKIDASKQRVDQIDISESIGQAKQREKKPYCPPPLSLLEPPMPEVAQDEDYEEKKQIIHDLFSSFNIEATVTEIKVGPTFSLYTMSVVMPKGKTISTLTSYEDDLAMRLEEESVRIIAPIPGKNACGVEVKNKHPRMVRISEVLQSAKFNQAKSPATFVIGKDLYNTDYIADVNELPHMLVAGATGQGKSCCLNSIIISFLYKATPDDLRLILIDPKRTEFSDLAGLPHLMFDEIICDVDKAIRALNWAISEMMRRMEFLQQHHCRDIDEYNTNAERDGFEKVPRIVVIVDELADLMSVGGKAVEDAINRLTRLARATNINLILATQRPSVDVIPGTIKNNIPTRISCKVSSGNDSRTVLDTYGAEKLFGKGDLYYMNPKSMFLTRIQGAYVDNSERHKVVEFVKEHNEAFFDENVKDIIFSNKEETPTKQEASSMKPVKKKDSGYPEELYDAMKIGMEESISASYLQRKLGLGFNKAARIFDIMTELGVLVPDEKEPKRKRVNMTQAEFDEFYESQHQESDEE